MATMSGNHPQQGQRVPQRRDVPFDPWQDVPSNRQRYYASDEPRRAAPRAQAQRSQSGYAPADPWRDARYASEPRYAPAQSRSMNQQPRQGSGGYRPAPRQQTQRHPAQPRRASGGNKSSGTLRMALIMILVVAAIVVVVRIVNSPTAGLAGVGKGDTYLKNIIVNGVELAGMTIEEGKAAMEQVVQQRMNTPITLLYQGKEWQIAPKDLDAKMDYMPALSLAFNFGHVGSAQSIRDQVEYLKKTPKVIDTELQYDESKLDAFIAAVKSEVDTPYTDAQIILKAQEIFDIVHSKDGYQLNAAELKEQVTSCITVGATPTIQLVPEIWTPHLTTEQANLITTTKLAEWTTPLKGSNDNRIANVKQALKPFRMMAVAPGETVSFNNVVGKRTKENGFKEAQEYLDGQLTTGIGGGTCQASTALYKPLVEAGFQIDKRFEHSMIVSYVHPGYDATVTDNGRKDFVFTNPTKYTMYIFAYCDSSETRVMVYGMPLPYKIKFVIKDIETNVQATSYIKKKDTKHRYVHNPGDPPVLDKEGKAGGTCEGWVYYYDLEDPTKEVKPAERIARSTYEPMKPIMWVYAD